MWRVLTVLALEELRRVLRRLFHRPEPPGRFSTYRDSDEQRRSAGDR